MNKEWNINNRKEYRLIPATRKIRKRFPLRIKETPTMYTRQIISKHFTSPALLHQTEAIFLEIY
jgi:hypothetical protein